MKKEITIENMHQINSLLKNSNPKKSYHIWTVAIPDADHSNKNSNLENSNMFMKNLWSLYEKNKISTYKKILDYINLQNINVMALFDTTYNQRDYSRNPDILELINYTYKKGYYEQSHDFSIYFNKFNKPTKSNIFSQVKLLEALDSSEKSFDIYCKLFNSYLHILPKTPLEDQKKIKALFEKFSDKDFFVQKNVSHQKFYPALVKVEELSDFQEDNFLCKRFCFSAEHKIPTLEKKIQDNLEYIYNNLFIDLKEKEIIQDFNTLLESNYFYLYVFTNSEEKLKNIGVSLKEFHQQIQCFIQNNEQSCTYYEKLFSSISLATSLGEVCLEKDNKKTKVKI